MLGWMIYFPHDSITIPNGTISKGIRIRARTSPSSSKLKSCGRMLRLMQMGQAWRPPDCSGEITGNYYILAPTCKYIFHFCFLFCSVGCFSSAVRFARLPVTRGRSQKERQDFWAAWMPSGGLCIVSRSEHKHCRFPGAAVCSSALGPVPGGSSRALCMAQLLC